MVLVEQSKVVTRSCRAVSAELIRRVKCCRKDMQRFIVPMEKSSLVERRPARQRHGIKCKPHKKCQIKSLTVFSQKLDHGSHEVRRIGACRALFEKCGDGSAVFGAVHRRIQLQGRVGGLCRFFRRSEGEAKFASSLLALHPTRRRFISVAAACFQRLLHRSTMTKATTTRTQTSRILRGPSITSVWEAAGRS